MSQGIEDVNQAATTAPAADEADQIWFVAVTGDDVRQMTLDQVAEAFESGVVTGQTAVWTEGMEEWAPLGDVADLGDEPSASSPGASAVAGSMEGGGEMNAPSVAATADVGGPATSAAAGPAAGLQPVFGEAAQEGGQPSGAEASFGNSPSPGFSGAGVSVNPSPAPFGQSTVPVALNVADDDPVPLKKSRSVGKWIAGMMGVAALAVTAVTTGILGDSKKAPQVTVTAAASRAEPVEALAEPPKAEAAEVKAEKAAEDLSAKPSDSKSLGDAPIGALAKTDSDSDSTGDKKSLRDGMASSLSAKKVKKSKKARKSRRKRRSKSRSSRRSKRRAASPKPAVAPTESAFDPLNGSLP